MTQVLQLATAINNFIVGCKADGIWDPIKACCIMGGWDGLSGALYPLKGAAPTNFNFVSGDYDRKTGLVGDGSTKYLDSNRNNNADPQDSKHLSIYAATVSNATQSFAAARTSSADVVGQTSLTSLAGNVTAARANAATALNGASLPIGVSTLIGVTRSNSAQIVYRITKTDYTGNITSETPTATSVAIFARKSGTAFDALSTSRLAFYSIGEALDLALLDARVTALMNAISAAVQDPSYANVSLLLHGDGANGSTTITDNSPSPKTVTAFGNAQISTAQSRFGGASIAFDGTEDYLTVPDSGPFTMGTSDFTIECWVRLSNTSHTGAFITTAAPVDYQGFFFGHVNGTLYFLADSGSLLSWDVTLAAGSLTANSWFHVAAVRSGNTFTSYVNGTQAATATSSISLTNNNSVLHIGGRALASQYFNGHIDDLRITKGVARYTANFIPPAAPFSDS